MQWVRLLTSSPCELQCPSLFTQSSPPAVHTPHPTQSLQPFSAGVTPGVKQATDRQGCGLSGREGAVVWIIYKLLCSKSALMKQFFGWSSQGGEVGVVGEFSGFRTLLFNQTQHGISQFHKLAGCKTSAQQDFYFRKSRHVSMTKQ